MTSPGTSSTTGSLPSGTVTFLFTDIEGSTQRWERDRSAMEAALRLHDATVREAIAAHGGYVFKTIGDAFCAAFHRAEDAANAAIAAQLALAAEDFTAVDGVRVRMALHTGTADERDGDYFGPTVNRVARLLAIGHGGQVLFSGVTADLVQGALGSHAALRDLGEHRLKDLARPEYVYQLVVAKLPSDFPPLRSLDLLPNNLPRQMTSFVGRETEVAEIASLLAKSQVVTIVGSGGVGKTRTSLQVAVNLLDDAPDGVWFIELAPLANGEYVAPSIAAAMGLMLAAEGDPQDNLVRALRTRRALLVFDNCEHLIEASANVVAAIVRNCPEMRVLASSRQALGIGSERTYRMPSLAVPSVAEAAALRASDAAVYPALALFADRANAADQRFALTSENASIVADICRRLDGIALAIELAAARVKILSLAQLRDRLDERFRVLTGGKRDALPRQQTLRALIDWSHDLLDDRERTLFRRLGMFVDGFSLEGASAVASGEDLDEFDVLELLASLVEKSLALAEPSGDTIRYRLLESTRAYAMEKLHETGERDGLAGRHLRYLRDCFTELFDRREVTARSAEIFAAFAVHLEGVRFALDDALARGDAVAGAELLAATEQAWRMGFDGEGVARNEAFIAALPRDESRLLGRLWATLAELMLNKQGTAARSLEAATAACSYARASGDGRTLAYALLSYAEANIWLHNFADADAALLEAAAVPQLSARLRNLLADQRATLSAMSGDLDGAIHGYEQLIAQNRALGNVRSVHSNVANLAEVEHMRGRTARAIELVRAELPAVRNGTDRNFCVMLLANLSGYLVACDDLAGAEEAGYEAIATLVLEPENVHVAVALEHLALVHALRENIERAIRLSGYAESAFRKIAFERQHTEQTSYDRLIALVAARCPPDERSRLMAEGAALSPEAAVALARLHSP